MSKASARKALSALVGAIRTADESLRVGETQVGSLQLRVGILLSEVQSVLGSRDDLPTLKEWTAKEYAGRSYSTLNRWAIAGRVATVLGYSSDSDDLPTVEEMHPLNRVLSKAKTAEEGAEALSAIWSKAQGSKKVRVAEAVLAGVESRVGPATKRPRNTPKTASDSAGASTVTVDTAEFEAQVESAKKTIGSMDRSLKTKFGELDPAMVLQIRSQILRVAGEWTIEATAVALGVAKK